MRSSSSTDPQHSLQAVGNVPTASHRQPVASRDKWLAEVSQDGMKLQHAPIDVRADRAVVLAAVSKNVPDFSRGHPLEYAAEYLRDDEQIVYAAIQVLKIKCSRVLEYVSPRLRADKALMLTAVKEDGYTLRFASEELRADPEVVLAAVHKDGYALRFASEELCSNRDFLLAAVSHGKGPDALGDVATELPFYREVVLAAVRKDGRALINAADDLRADREVGVQPTHNVYTKQVQESHID